MADSCCGAQVKFEGLSADYRRRLWMVIVINAVMFVVEMIGGVLAQSQALQADALDFLGDTLTYGINLCRDRHKPSRAHEPEAHVRR